MGRKTRVLHLTGLTLLLMGGLFGCQGAGAGRLPAPVNPPATGFRATFLGVSTILIEDGHTAVMTDGFFSRPDLVSAMLCGGIAPDDVRIRSALAKAGVGRLVAVLTAHSHYDHAFDTAVVAEKTGAVIVGSESTANIARGASFPEHRIRIVHGGERLPFGSFNVDVIESPHSPNDRFPGEITGPLKPPAPISAYKFGGNFSFLIEHESGRRVLVHPSANFTSGVFKGKRADVVFLGIGELGKRDAEFIGTYWREVVRETGAKVVIPIHWDNFFRSLDAPLEPIPRPFDDVAKSMTVLTALATADGVTLRMPKAFETFDLTAGGIAPK